MAADPTLVKGAALSAPKFRETKIFDAQTIAMADKLTAARKAKKIARDAAISALVSDIVVDESLTPPQQIQQQYEMAGNIRNQVAQLAAQRAQLPVNSPEAFALDQQISTLKQSFTNIANNAKDFKELEKEYIEDGSWNMSGGVDENKRSMLDKIFVEKAYTIKYDQYGNATYVTDIGELSQKELSNYYAKDDEMALQIVDFSDKTLNLGTSGVQMKKGGNRYNMIKTQIRNEIRKGGESRIQSLIHDDLVEGQSLGLADLGDKQANEDAAVEAIMARLLDVNQQGYNEYLKKNPPASDEEEEENNLTPGEKQRRASVEAAEKELNQIDLGDFETKKDPMRGNAEYRVPVRKRPAEDILKDYNNIIGAQNYKIVAVDGHYFLEPQLPSLSQKEREDFTIKVTDEVTQALGGNNVALNKRLMTDVFKQKPIDRLGTSDDKNLD